MSASQKFVLFLGLILVVVLLVFWQSLSENNFSVSGQSENKPAEAITPIDKPSVTKADPVLGPANAKVTIVVFSDFRCPHCSEADLQLKKIFQAHPDKVRLVWKDFPVLPPLDLAWKVHEAARCAEEQGQFWAYHDVLFANQANLSSERLSELADSLGLDSTRFKDCLDNGQTLPLVQRAANEGTALNVDGVPYYFVNGERYNSDITLNKIEEMIYEVAPKK